ncbi:MAG: DUF362 domain-containing protein [Lentisphaeria bacterium]|nr:DUF362 domain-containing protein [Lentisphaeria bacterium]
MSSKVYFKPVSAKAPADEICRTAGELLSAYLEREKVQLEKKIPLKVHFGERGNRTYLVPHTYDAIIDLLEKRGVESFFAETSVLYGGERFNREKHLKLAQAHGFTRIPAVIADGAHGEEAEDVEVNLKYFRYCSLGKLLADSPQTLVLSHFKGHMLAGFGGAIKQLSMGFASKGGKMAMHLGVKPKIWNFLCKRCKLCMTRCQRNAITIGKKSFIDHEKCIGCGACFSICPRHAVSILNLSSLWNALFGKQIFREKLVEYAYASHHGKRNIYMNFAVNVTAGCDCEPRPMRPCVDNIGIFISADPVAIDTACLEAVQAKGRHFKGAEQLAYAEKIGLGSRKYKIINI